MNLTNNFNLVKYSFSGSDARAYTQVSGVEGNTPYRPIDSMHTISVSIHEAKAQVRSLGHKSIKGVTKGIRTIAGSLILTVINDNPLRPFFINDQAAAAKFRRGGWSLDSASDRGFSSDLTSSVRLASTLFPVDIMILYVTEIPNGLNDLMSKNVPEDFVADGMKKLSLKADGRDALVVQNAPGTVNIPQLEYCRLLIRGVEFIDEGVVTSVNDVVTEVNLSFIAREVVTLDNLKFDPKVEIQYSDEIQSVLQTEFDEYTYYNGLVLNQKNKVDQANREQARYNSKTSRVPGERTTPYIPFFNLEDYK